MRKSAQKKLRGRSSKALRKLNHARSIIIETANLQKKMAAAGMPRTAHALRMTLSEAMQKLGEFGAMIATVEMEEQKKKDTSK